MYSYSTRALPFDDLRDVQLKSKPQETIVLKMNTPDSSFEVFVSKDTFKFNAAHFVAFRNFRERLHGHNYRVSVRLLGKRKIAHDGYLIDFGNVKDVTKTVCKTLNEHFLCPMYSDVMEITTTETSVTLNCEDGGHFVFPRGDCAMLPIVHATAEELAIYLYAEILNALDASYLEQRGIHTMEVTVAEAPGQEAVFRHVIPEEARSYTGGKFRLDVRHFITSSGIEISTPSPCPAACVDCQSSKQRFQTQLEQIAAAMNQNKGLIGSGQDVTASMLEKLLLKSKPQEDDSNEVRSER